jgi:hypothetical protein
MRYPENKQKGQNMLGRIKTENVSSPISGEQ